VAFLLNAPISDFDREIGAFAFSEAATRKGFERSDAREAIRAGVNSAGSLIHSGSAGYFCVHE
jgi:hypothetical protein